MAGVDFGSIYSFKVCVSSLEWNVELKKCISTPLLGFNEGSAHDIRAVRGKTIAERTALGL